MEELSWVQRDDLVKRLRSRHYASVAVSGDMQCPVLYKENGSLWLSSSHACGLLGFNDSISSIKHLIQPALQRYFKDFCVVKPSPFSLLTSVNDGSIQAYSIFINAEALGILMCSDVEYVGLGVRKRNVSEHQRSIEFLHRVVEAKGLMPPAAKNQKIFTS